MPGEEEPRKVVSGILQRVLLGWGAAFWDPCCQGCAVDSLGRSLKESFLPLECAITAQEEHFCKSGAMQGVYLQGGYQIALHRLHFIVRKGRLH